MSRRRSVLVTAGGVFPRCALARKGTVMRIELTEEQRRVLASSAESPPRLIDPATNTAYVLVRAEVYERLRALLDHEMPDVSALINEVMAEDDANDPLLEGYQHYRRGPA
jgi:hypothetical protein